MKVTAILQFLLVLVACSAHVVVSSSLYGNETDRLSLLEFKKAISLDSQEALTSWNDSNYFCNWEGVHCRMRNPRRVTSLELANQGLAGQISSSLGNLTFLRYLFLSTNSFTGEIPPSLGHLHHLQIIYLSNNTLQGIIPSFANCSNLKVLWLDHNNLVGQIPIDLPHSLQQLQLTYNNLTGTIPASVANITMLNQVSCVYNNIEGNIPVEFAKLHALQVLYLGENRLSGRFPQAILNLSTLVRLDLDGNYLSGEVPSFLGSSLPNLQLLVLSGNRFDGHIPSSLVNASKLFIVHMSSNNFSGVVPSSIGRLKGLFWLSFQDNQLQAHDEQDMEFMNGLSNCTELQKLSLQGNHLEGQIPNSFGNLSVKLREFYFGGNRLSGHFPTGLANLHSLTSLGLQENQFTGVIPEWLGTLKNLQEIVLSNNIFTGYIPSSLSNLSQLGNLFLGSNHLYGYMPSSLGNLKILESLDISNNNLHGLIPKGIFNIPTIRGIGLSVNSLDGALPIEVGNAKQLVYLLLSSNNLSNGIPETLGNCESMEKIELGHNFFSGGIPASLGNISSLEVLNMSHNHLSGSIPKSIGSLKYLELLDLSFNHLEGEVPEKGVFRNTSAIWIAGNKGLCGGAAILRLAACPFISSSSAKHMPSIVLKVVIPLASMVSLALVITALLVCRRKQKKRHMSLPSFGRKCPKVSYNDLARATDGFSASNLIGRGRYSSVYKGTLLQDGNVVAVKVVNLETRGAQKSFIAECNTLRNVRHRNLVPILTACSSIDAKGNDFKALVYEFMPKGDLNALLYPTRGDENTTSSLNRITLAQRLSIVVDVADALEYLHHNNQGTVVHCDLKPSNILLDDNMTAHVGDFGLASFKIDSATSYFGESNSTSSITIKGTIGYVPPECTAGGEVSIAGDVYSFGIVLLEIFLRKRPIDDMFKDGLNIANFVEMNFPARISLVVDPELLQDQPCFSQKTLVGSKEKDFDCLLSVLNVGLCCTKLPPNERLNMQQVAARLHGIRVAYLREN